MRWSANITRSALLALALLPASSQTTPSGIDKLFSGFQDPPREYTIRPFWFWNGKLDPAEVNRQIEEMVSQGVYGAYVHNRTGLQTPYLSEEYFQVVGSALKRSRELGFHFSVVDDYEWPSGEARDVWRKGLPSKVIAANPEFRMRSLGYIERIVEGPRRVEIDGLENFQFAVAARMTGPDTLEEPSLTEIRNGFSDGRLTWDVPAGRWTVLAYYLYPSQGFDGGLVDLMNPAAVRTFLDLSYEQYYKRFGEYFGNVLDSTFADHEGGYGFRLAWTPALFDSFLAAKGYDLHKYLPLLIHDGGKLTPKVRCDYLDHVSELYATNFFGQVAGWCKAHKIAVSGHVWEEALQMEAAFDGDLQRVMRNRNWSGVDSLVDRGRSPHDFKVAGSVSHFRGTRFVCENQGLHGNDSFLDPQKMRLGTNMIGAWGVNVFVPHAFNYNRNRIEYPPDWFYHQPYWKYFKQYADYTRRISFMNDGGAHVADVLLYQPTETAWANADPVFSTAKWDGSFASWPNIPFNNVLDTVNLYYTRLMETLARERWDYDVADSHYLIEAGLGDRRLEIGNEKFRVLILPPVTTMRREAARKIAKFFDAGGTVIATGFLPADSMEEGRNDPEIRSAMEHVFGTAAPQASLHRTGAGGGRAFFVKDNVADVIGILEKNFRQDVKVTSAARDGLYYLHRRKDDTDFYWLVNDSGDARDFTVSLASAGVPEKWDAAGGAREPLFYTAVESGAELRLRFAPWEAYYVVFRPSSGARNTARVEGTNLEDIGAVEVTASGVRVRGTAPQTSAAPLYAKVTDAAGKHYRGELNRSAQPPLRFADEWTFTPDGRSTRMPYAMIRRDYRDEGEAAGWHRKGYPEIDWTRTWLSRERSTIRQWSLMGPFPNEDYKGFHEAYPPEKSFDPEASYPGENGTSLRWINWDETETYYTNMPKALGIPDSRRWVTSYAHTFIYSPTARRVELRTTADNNAKVWLNGKNLLDWLIVPFYYEMREDFALTREADLNAGWNDLLLKVSKGPRGSFQFMVRVTDEQGNNIDDLVISREKRDPAAAPEAAAPAGFHTWYRIPVPASAVGVKLPRIRAEHDVFYDGAKLRPSADGSVKFESPAYGADNVLAIRVAGDGSLADEPEFQLGAGRMKLGSWTDNGLTWYSGSAAYEQEIEIPHGYAGGRLLLDCGRVGVAAEVSVNGQSAGARVWLPYRFDITRLVHPGKNKVRILVTNTMESARAVEDRLSHLERMKLDGLLGPVEIVPYQDVTIDCKPAAATTARVR